MNNHKFAKWQKRPKFWKIMEKDIPKSVEACPGHVQSQTELTKHQIRVN